MGASRASNSAAPLRDANVIVTHIEVNQRHGVGVLVGRLFRNTPRVLSVRSQDYHGGCQEFGDVSLRISHQNTARDAVFQRVLDGMGRNTAARVVSIPYFADDVRNSIAIKESFGVPLCTYLMDDQNICAESIPDSLMRELLAKSALRLAISPQMRIIYQRKYGYPIWYMPPTVAGRLMPSYLTLPSAVPLEKRGVIIGNIWGARWLELLRESVRDSGVVLDWYSIGGYQNVPGGTRALAADSILAHASPTDDELVNILRERWFAVLPSGTLDESDDRRFLAQLSLPSRLIYLLATSHIPVLVLGNRDTPAARFVEQFGIGIAAGYGQASFLDAVNRITAADTNLVLRKRALAVAGRFTDVGAAEWIWQSLARGEPLDRRYEDLMPDPAPDLSQLLRVAHE